MRRSILSGPISSVTLAALSVFSCAKESKDNSDIQNTSATSASKVVPDISVSDKDALLNPALFNLEFYKSKHKDLASLSDEQIKVHWLNTGSAEGREPSLFFSHTEYSALHKDLVGMSARELAIHFSKNARSERRAGRTLLHSNAFDVSGYRHFNADLSSLSDLAAVEHWLTKGSTEGRQASPFFNVKSYLSGNPDLQKSFGANGFQEAILHFVKVGQYEQRIFSAGDGVKVTGSSKVIFNYATSRCDEEDIPDLPTRAFRNAEGIIQFIATHSINRRMTGTNFSNLKRDCEPIYKSPKNSNWKEFKDFTWVASFYTFDGKSVYTLNHNEYHGHEYDAVLPGTCPSRVYAECWYNAITSAFSHDGGKTFAVNDTPNHIVARPTYEYAAGIGPAGYMEPSNIVRNAKDGLFYAMFRKVSKDQNDQGTCVMRTADLSKPSSWRAWDGKGYNANFYPGGSHCTAVSPQEIGQMSHSLTYNKHFGKFLLVSMQMHPTSEKDDQFGFYYSVSDDLINWTQRRLLLRAPLPWGTAATDGNRVEYAYPSLIDSNDTGRNFEVTGRSSTLYFTKFHPIGVENPKRLDRDLVAVQIEFD